MKVLMLNYEFPPIGGGAAVQTNYLLEELGKKQEISIDLVTSSSGKSYVEKFSNNITIHYLGISKNTALHYQRSVELLNYTIQATKYCRKLVKHNKYDLCHAYFGNPCGFIASKLKLPYIVSLCGSDVPFFSQRFWLMDRLLFKKLSKIVWQKAKVVIANSQGLRELALQTNANQQIEIITNGINLKEFTSKTNKLGGTSKKVNVLCVSRLIARKRLFELIAAVTELPEIVLTIVGDGPLSQKIGARIPPNVLLLGEILHHELPAIYNKHDLFILPSENEGMSNSVLEAMACGLPIVISQTGGTKELVQGNGIVLEEISAKEIKRALSKIVANPLELEKWGKRSIEIAKDLSCAKTANQYVTVYKRISLSKGK